jgi:hypothetical protein
MREVRPEWIAALKAVDGGAELRWNSTVGRWEFILSSADGVPRSQFWGWFYRIERGKRVPTTPDPVTGLYPFRDLDDDAMREAIDNLTRSFIGNPFDGAGTTRREVMRRYRYNRELQSQKYREAGEAFADMAAERGRRLRGAPLIHVPVTIGK